MARIIADNVSGEAQEVGKWLAERALFAKLGKEERPLCLLSCGETTVTVKGTGKGGRNMELALAFALEIDGMPGITLHSAGSDGTDGPTDATGAIVDGITVIRAQQRGLDWMHRYTCTTTIPTPSLATWGGYSKPDQLGQTSWTSR